MSEMDPVKLKKIDGWKDLWEKGIFPWHKDGINLNWRNTGLSYYRQQENPNQKIADFLYHCVAKLKIYYFYDRKDFK